MIKRNMKKIAPNAFAAMDKQAMLDAFGKYVRMKPLCITEEKSQYVMVLFTGTDVELSVFEEDGNSPACGLQTGVQGKFMVFDSKHSYALTGEDYVVIHFKEQV